MPLSKTWNYRTALTQEAARKVHGARGEHSGPLIERARWMRSLYLHMLRLDILGPRT